MPSLRRKKNWDNVAKEAERGSKIYKIIRRINKKYDEEVNTDYNFPNYPPDESSQANTLSMIFSKIVL